jgi:signal transduction histidine kinase
MARSHRILIVDDDPVIQSLLQDYAEMFGYASDTAGSGEEALTGLRPEIDLLLLDVEMDGMDGFEVTRHIRADPVYGDLPIIMVTGHASQEQRLKAVEAGVNDFVGKPIDGVELRVRVASVLRTKDAQDAVKRHQAELEDRIRERTAALAEALGRAEEASRAKSAFLATMGHELRTPLNHILGYSDMLLEEVEEEGHAEWARELRSIQTAGKGLLELVTRSLEFARTEAGEYSLHPDEVALAPFMDTLAEPARSRLEGTQVRLEVWCPCDAGHLRTDPGKLEQLLHQVLDNAAKFTDEGSIRLAVQRDEADAAVFEVTDTGIGMTAEQAERAFEVFNQADNSSTRRYEGTGLGLALARQLSRLLGGSIAIESEPGRGTTVRVRIPPMQGSGRDALD